MILWVVVMVAVLELFEAMMGLGIEDVTVADDSSQAM